MFVEAWKTKWNKEKVKELVEIGLYAAALTLKWENKLTIDVAAHLLCEICRFIWFYFVDNWIIKANVSSTQSKMYLVPRGVTDIILKAKPRIREQNSSKLKYLRQIIEENFEPWNAKKQVEHQRPRKRAQRRDQAWCGG